MARTYNIGISSIGSGVGQSIINSCRLSNLPLRTIGLGTNPFAYGAYDCSQYDYLPSIYSENYTDALVQKCKEYKIDLLIPGLDDEVLVISENINKFQNAGILPLVANKELVRLCRDKDQMSRQLNKSAEVFVQSFSKEELLSINSSENVNVNYPLIAKPRGGFASRGVKIIKDATELAQVPDNYIIQELAIPKRSDPNYNYCIQQIEQNLNPQVSEISIQLVADQNGKLIGKMASYNKLNNGVPIEIVPIEKKEIWDVVEKLIPKLIELGLKGPLNIQGRITDKGLKIFEMNPRFTGITGLRALMGFNEVEASIKSWLNIDNTSTQLKLNNNRFGVRQTEDKSIPLERNQKVSELYDELNNEENKRHVTILITGATGFLGRNFIKNIEQEKEYSIYAFSRDKEKFQKIFDGCNIQCFDRDDFNSGKLSLGNVDIILHFGFARPHCSNNQIAESLSFAQELFTRAAMNHVPAVVNISSQSVYGLEQEPLWNEGTPTAPSTAYAQAKYATELMLNSLMRINNQFRTTSLRLAALSGGQEGLIISDIASKFAQKVLQHEPIKILGGTQTFEILDIRDAVNAIKALLKIPPSKWKKVYNVGANKTYNIKNIARMAVNTVKKYNGNTVLEIECEEKDVKMNFGMDSKLFIEDTKWSPEYSIESTMDSLMDYLNKLIMNN
jgi:nucleoside-diphosphate-sugar epimerase